MLIKKKNYEFRMGGMLGTYTYIMAIVINNTNDKPIEE